jgi:ribosomal protein S18 acetylase RimI-like enzyme
MSNLTGFYLKPATTPSDFTATRELFTSYAESLGISLSFQNFAQELESLPGLYSRPTGAILLAFNTENIAVGCVALRPLPSASAQEKICEMKRLYCTPQARGLGVGRALVDAVLKEAEELAYEEMRLDTLPHMIGARKLYENFGFKVIEPYYETPLTETIFLAKKLTA